MFASLSLRGRRHGSLKQGTINFLSSAINGPNLRKLHLTTMVSEIHRISSSPEWELEELIIDDCSHKQVCDILPLFPNLRVFSSNYYTVHEEDSIVLSTSFRRLTSLTLQSPRLAIDQLESLLSFTPSLVRLHIASYSSDFDLLRRVSQWEQFILHRLPLLALFKFHLFTYDYSYENVQDVEAILHAFRTPFWLKEKRWYVTCKYINDEGRAGLMLYSPPTSNMDFPDNLWAGILSYSMSTTEADDQVQTISTWNARLDLSAMHHEITSEKVCIAWFSPR
jgi:hypothetical protein